MMRHRLYRVGAATGLFATVAIAGSPAMATPCTNLQSLHLQDTTITSATDNTTGVFVVSGSSPPTTITGLPAFCRVTANLIPNSDSNIKIEVWLPETTWNGRFLGTGGGGFQGVITYGELASGIQHGFAATNGPDDPAALRLPQSREVQGSGSTSIAANFTCVADEPDFNQTPAPKFGP